MAISDDVTTIWTEKGQREAFFKARALMEEATNSAEENLAAFKVIKDSGQFNTLPANLKTTMLAWESMFDDLKTAFLANANVVAIYNWRP